MLLPLYGQKSTAINQQKNVRKWGKSYIFMLILQGLVNMIF